MKNSTIMKLMTFLVILLLSSAGLFAQSDPVKVTAEGADLYKSGLNSANTTTPVASENPDSVALSGTQKYYVLPDKNANPSFDVSSPFANVLSTFAWTLAPANGTVNAVGTNPTNYKQITWNTLGTVTMTVIETAATGQGGCEGTSNSINIEVINQPTYTIKSGSTSSSVGICNFPTSTVDVPITLATSIKSADADEVLYIRYKINDGSSDIYTSPATFETTKFKPGENTLSIPIARFGTVAAKTYTITILAVNDRISRKSTTALNGSLSTGGTAGYALTVLPQPVTGPIYHLPNM